ncbi:hypothetical protein IGI39_004638 [Enterococcus sp. AZ135]|uniref:TetR/AcrR family transcriptional regulator n=1 Tax=unclassified Enterococcus TaxID=2608891 RepID=UPI003F22DEB7
MRSKNKEIQRKRMLGYFIEATQMIIEKEGIENVTIRKVSSLAGYNSATLYNYFENLDQLIAFTLINNVREYFIALNETITGNEESYITFLLTWREYALYSFKNPEIYSYVFYSKYSSSVLGYVDSYLDTFEVGDISEDKEKYHRFLGRSIQERDDLIGDPCIKDGYIAKKDKQYIFDFCYALNLGMCTKMKNGDFDDPQSATKLFLDYLIDFLLNHSTISKDKDELLESILSF